MTATCTFKNYKNNSIDVLLEDLNFELIIGVSLKRFDSFTGMQQTQKTIKWNGNLFKERKEGRDCFFSFFWMHIQYDIVCVSLFYVNCDHNTTIRITLSGYFIFPIGKPYFTYSHINSYQQFFTKFSSISSNKLFWKVTKDNSTMS